MDDVDFILGQYEEGKGVSKKGLTFVFKLSLIEHIPFAMLRMTYVIESRDRSSDCGQAHTRFEGGTHENRTERNKTSYGIREREREKERYLDLVGR